MPLSRVLRIRLWLRSSRTGLLPSRRRLMLRGRLGMLRGLRRLRPRRSLLLLRLRLWLVLRQRWRVSVPTMLVWLGMLRLVLLRLLLGPRRMRRRRRLMLPGVPRMRRRLVPLLWWRVLGRSPLGLARRMHATQRTDMQDAPRPLLIRST